LKTPMYTYVNHKLPSFLLHQRFKVSTRINFATKEGEEYEEKEWTQEVKLGREKEGFHMDTEIYEECHSSKLGQPQAQWLLTNKNF